MDAARRAYIDKLTAFLEERRGALEEILCALIRANTVNPPGNEDVAAEIVLEALRQVGVEGRTVEAQPRRTNVLVGVGPASPALLVAAHLDVVPAGEGWASDPFEPVVAEGKVTGRGASDNKGVAAAMLALAPFLVEHAGELGAGALLAFVADEEQGSRLGMDYLTDEGYFDAVDAAIIPDCEGNMLTIYTSEKGLLHLKVTAHGRAAHGSTPQLGSNAILHMLDLVARLDEIGLAEATHPLHTPATWNVGTIDGGQAPNVVPATCAAEIDIRYLPGQSADAITETLRRIADDVAAEKDECSFDIDTMMHLAPAAVNDNAPIIAAVSQAAREILGTAPDVAGLSGTTVTKQLVYKGIDAVSFAPGDKGVAHTADEYVCIDELVQFAEVLGLLLYDFGRDGLPSLASGDA